MDHLTHVVSSLIALCSLCITVLSRTGCADVANLVCNLKHSIPELVVFRILLISNVPFEGRDTDNGDEVKQAGEGARPNGELFCEVGRLAEREDVCGVDGEIGKLVERGGPVIRRKVVESVVECI